MPDQNDKELKVKGVPFAFLMGEVMKVDPEEVKKAERKDCKRRMKNRRKPKDGQTSPQE